jgi:hypothetical protein
VVTILMVGLGWLSIHPVAACGYHDPDMIRVGVLNWVYPECLHVKGAMWRAQKAGLLPPPDKERLAATGKTRELLDLRAYQEAQKSLMALGTGLAEMAPDGESAHFSMVLVETCLWTQFNVSGESESVEIDAIGPADGPVVVVTGEPVLHTMRNGKLTLSKAIEVGVAKLYGEPEEIDRFVKAFGEIGGSELKAPPHVLAQKVRAEGSGSAKSASEAEETATPVRK